MLGSHSISKCSLLTLISLFPLFFLQDLRELRPGFHVRRCQRSRDVEHLDRNAERVLLCHSEAEEDCYLLRPWGLRLRPESAERYHVSVFQLPDRQKPSQRMFFIQHCTKCKILSHFYTYITVLNIYIYIYVKK